MNPPAPVTSAVRSVNNRLDGIDRAAERPQDWRSFNYRLNGFASARHDIRREDRDEIRVLPTDDSAPSGRDPTVDRPGRIRLLFVLAVIRRQLLNNFQSRIVSIRLQDDDLVRQPTCLADNIRRVVIVVQNSLIKTKSNDLSSNGTEWPSRRKTRSFRPPCFAIADVIALAEGSIPTILVGACVS